MRNVKNITAGVAILLCIFICIYILTLYLKFTPEEPKLLEDGTYEEIDGKIKQFLDSDVNIKEHLTLVFLLAFSAAAGFLLEKLPAFGMVTSALPLSYALTMLRFLPSWPWTAWPCACAPWPMAKGPIWMCAGRKPCAGCGRIRPGMAASAR